MAIRGATGRQLVIAAAGASHARRGAAGDRNRQRLNYGALI